MDFSFLRKFLPPKETAAVPRLPPPKHLADFLEREGDPWRKAVRDAQGGPEILLASSVGGHAAVRELDMILAIALTLRGAKVSFLLCDGALTACEQCTFKMFKSPWQFVEVGPSNHCQGCFGAGDSTYGALGLPILKYSDFLSHGDKKSASRLAKKTPMTGIPEFKFRGLSVGEHASAGALRFFARGDLGQEECAEPVLRRYFEASLLTAMALGRLLASRPFRCCSFHHGIYIPQGIIGEVARQAGVRIANWVVAYRKQRFIFSHGDTYHHTLVDEPVSTWESITWTDKIRHQTEEYLKSRWQGSQDWIYFHDNPTEDIEQIRRELQFEISQPAVLLLTNVIWDAQLHYRANAFANMLDWIEQTIRYFSRRQDLNLIIRIHPAEIRGGIPSRQLMAEEIARRFPLLPANIRVIGPDKDVSTYALALDSDAAIIYGTKTGVELTSIGIPVIVAGEAWIRNKGLTEDATSPESYFRLLDSLPKLQRLPEETKIRALKYAYHFFFRRMIPLRVAEQIPGTKRPFTMVADSLESFSEHSDPGLGVICRGIIEGAPFVYHAEDETEDAVVLSS